MGMDSGLITKPENMTRGRTHKGATAKAIWMFGNTHAKKSPMPFPANASNMFIPTNLANLSKVGWRPTHQYAMVLRITGPMTFRGKSTEVLARKYGSVQYRPFSCSRSTAPRSSPKVESTPMVFIIMPFVVMKKSTPTLSCTEFWSFPTRNQMSDRSTPTITAWRICARPRMGFRLRSLKPRRSSTTYCTLMGQGFCKAREARLVALSRRTILSGKPSTENSLCTACSRAPFCGARLQACRSNSPRSPSAPEPSGATSTCMNKKSAGLAYCGQGKPTPPKCGTASAAGPLKTTWPPRRIMRSSKSAKMSEEGWCSVHTTVLLASWAWPFRTLTSKCALKASKPLVGSSRKKICGSRTADMATAVRLRSPPLSPLTLPRGSPTGVSAHPSNWKIFKTCATRSRFIAVAMLPGSVRSAAMVTASRTVCEAMMASS
mmetsp:Transcript_86700/g.240455  ORF Transcript_86700/g.240455 Transcript_86700/m.240455 type:complete len:433 (-) Transcript_86700:440-1738(-)